MQGQDWSSFNSTHFFPHNLNEGMGMLLEPRVTADINEVIRAADPSKSISHLEQVTIKEELKIYKR